jgi:biotin transport system substrate-specific component
LIVRDLGNKFLKSWSFGASFFVIKLEVYMNSTAIRIPAITDVTKVLMGALLIAIMAQISIPLEPVPITLQTVAVLFIGLTYSPIRAVQSVVAYILLGIFGAPVFQGFDSGFSVLSGATGGYILGFIAAVYSMAKIREINKSTSYMILSVLTGQAIIFALGVAWLSAFIGLEDAIKYGVLPFVIPGVAKSTMLVALLKALRK